MELPLILKIEPWPMKYVSTLMGHLWDIRAFRIQNICCCSMCSCSTNLMTLDSAVFVSQRMRKPTSPAQLGWLNGVWKLRRHGQAATLQRSLHALQRHPSDLDTSVGRKLSIVNALSQEQHPGLTGLW